MRQTYRHRRPSSDRAHAKSRSFLLVPDEATKSRYDLSPSADRSRDRTPCQKPKTRRRSLSSSRLMSGSSTGRSKVDRNPEHKSLGTARGESCGNRRRRSFTLTRAVMSEFGKVDETIHRKKHQEEMVRCQRESDSRLSRSRSGCHGVTSSLTKTGSSRTLADADTSDGVSLPTGENERQMNQGKKGCRPSLAMAPRRRSLSVENLLSIHSTSRSSRRLVESDYIDDDPSISWDKHKRLNSDSIQKESRSIKVTSGRLRETMSSSRHHHRSGSKSERDLMESAHTADDNRSSRGRMRRSQSRHREHCQHRSRSRHSMSSGPEDQKEPESKTAVKNFIKGLLKDGSSIHNRQADERSVCPSRRKTRHDRRQSCGGLDTHSRRPSSRRTSGNTC
jgi:hypothetical protein